jgi:hypothetical protein
MTLLERGCWMASWNPIHYRYKQDAFYMFETIEELLRHLVIYDLLRSSIL